MSMTEKDHMARIERLSRRQGGDRPDAQASRFVRIMRLVLPLVAVGIVAALFVAKDMEQEVIVPTPANLKSAAVPAQIVQNELLNPKFESRDKQNRPYEIIAKRAVQGENNKDLIMLDKPVGTMTMSGDRQIKVTAESGAYRQDTERFFLEGGVVLENSEGYVLRSEEAHMDLKERLTWSEKPVSGEGPDMAIEASGLKANAQSGEIVFIGPATLTLKEGLEGFK